MYTKMELSRKLHILKTLTKSKSVKRSSIIKDAFLYIYQLKLQVEAIEREYQYLINHIQEVRVEKLGTGFFSVRVTCKKSQYMLASIVRALEGMHFNILQARVTCKHFFGMEAIVRAQDQDFEAGFLTETILDAIQNST